MNSLLQHFPHRTSQVLLRSKAVLLWVIKSSNLTGSIYNSATKNLRRLAIICKPPSIRLEAALMALAPCSLLFYRQRGFYGSYIDWYNHRWPVGYAGSYFLSHFNFPDVLNTQQVVGMSMPIFYGFGLYNWLGLLCVVLTPHVALLIGIYTLYFLQHGSIVLLLKRMLLPRWFSSITAATVTFAVYPLTNVYNRGALTEFFATVALTIAVTALLLSLILEERGQKRLWYLVALVMFGFIGMTHPITLLNAGIFMSVFCPLLLLAFQIPYRSVMLPLLAIPLILGLLLSPWLYATLTFYGEIRIIKIHLFWLYSNNIDWIVSRLSPIPFDRRIWHIPFNKISTPYLEAPINSFILGLALILITYVIRQCSVRIGLLIFIFIMFGAFLFYLWCSVSIYPYAHILPFSYRIIQFPYRLVSFINLTALCMLFGVGLWLKIQNKTIFFPQGARTAAMVLCIIATFAFSQKMTHASSVQAPVSEGVFITPDERKQLLQLPKTMYGTFDYVTLGFYDAHPLVKNGKGLHFEVASEPFGEVNPLQVNIETEGWYGTNIYNFAWNKVTVDGYEDIPGSLRGVLSVYLTPGQHEIKYMFSPPLAWVILRGISLATSVVVLLCLFYSCISQSGFIPAKVRNMRK